MPKVEQFRLKNIVSSHSAIIDASSITKLSIKDKITPEYNESIGYGKFDPIMSWKRTSRTVSVDFTVNGHNLTQKLIKDFSLLTLPKYQNINYDPIIDQAEVDALTSNPDDVPDESLTDEELLQSDIPVETGPASNTAFVVSGAPIYRLNLFGYFDEFGIIKNLSVMPDFDKKTLVYEGRQKDATDGGTFINVLSADNIQGLSYSFQKVQVTFDYVVLHKITPSFEIASSLNSWPMKK